MAIKIEVKELKIENIKIEELKIFISLNILDKFDIIKLKFDKNKIMNIIKKAKNKGNQKQIKLEDIKYILQKFKIEKANIKTDIGTENPAITAILVAIISIILDFAFSRTINNYKYNINPIYENKNYLFLSINCIFKIKLVHIINIIRKLKRKEYQENGKTSN